MHFEHVALNVPNARAMAAWYAKHCGLRIIRAQTDAPFTHFLGDVTGRIFLEIYSNEQAPIPDYASQPPLVLHVAYAVTDIDAEKERLLAEGATVATEQELPDGTHLVMMRDPWGIPLQLCKRGTPL